MKVLSSFFWGEGGEGRSNSKRRARRGRGSSYHRTSRNVQIFQNKVPRVQIERGRLTGNSHAQHLPSNSQKRGRLRVRLGRCVYNHYCVRSSPCFFFYPVLTLNKKGGGGVKCMRKRRGGGTIPFCKLVTCFREINKYLSFKRCA